MTNNAGVELFTRLERVRKPDAPKSVFATYVTVLGLGFQGRFVGMHDFGASGKIGDVYKKFDITTDAVVRAAKESLAEVFG